MSNGNLYCSNPYFAHNLLWAREINDGRNGSSDLQLANRYVRQWLVKTRHAEVPANVVRNHPDIPNFGANYFVENPDGENWRDTNVGVVEKLAYIKNVDDPTIWVVSVTYDQSGSPLSRYWDVVWDEVEFEKVATKNIDDGDKWHGEAIVNSAGDPFDPPIVTDDSYSQLIITRYENSYKIENVEKFRHSINNTPIVIDGFLFPENTLKLKSYKGIREVVGGQIYFRCTLVIEYRPKTWVDEVLDAGYRMLNNDIPPKRIHITDSINNPVVTPHLLNGLGKPLPKGNDPKYLKFLYIKRANFGELFLDYSIYGIPGNDQLIAAGFGTGG